MVKVGPISQNGKSVHSMYILFGSPLALQDARARSRRAEPPAQPRLVACLGLIARLQLLLPSAPSPACHQVFLDSLHYVRGACKLGRYVYDYVLTRKWGKKFGVSSSSIS